MSLIIMTGASGSGKTVIAEAIECAAPSIAVFHFDSVGVPSAKVMESYGMDHQPGGAWQRDMTFQWMATIAPLIAQDRDVLFEGQMRVSFILEAMKAAAIEHAGVLLVDCDDGTRRSRLTDDRRQPELANEDMMRWSRFLRQEAVDAGCIVLDTTSLSVAEAAQKVLAMFSA